MKALVRLVDVRDEPVRIRLTPQPVTPADQEWLLAVTEERLFMEFEISIDGLKLLLVEAAEINSRR